MALTLNTKTNIIPHKDIHNFLKRNADTLSNSEKSSLMNLFFPLMEELSSIKEKKNSIDILIASLSRLIKTKLNFIDTLCLNLQEMFNLTSTAFVEYPTNNILSLMSYGEDSNNLIKTRIDKYILQSNIYDSISQKDGMHNIYCFSIYFLDQKLATLYIEREVSLEYDILENIEELCDIIGALYNQVLLYQNLEKNKDYIHKILDTQTNFTLITDGKILKQANKTVSEFFGYKTLDEFYQYNNDIGDFFIKQDGYLSSKKDNKTWLDIILEDTSKKHKVKIQDFADNVHTFQINTNGKKIVEEEEEEEEELYVITFTDITEIENNKSYISSILEASDEAQIIIDQHSYIIDYNNQALEIFEHIRKNITIGKLFEEEEEEEEEASKLKYFLNCITFDHNHSHIFKHQNDYFKVKYKYLNDNTHIILFQNITQLILLQNNLEQKVKDEVEKNRSKDLKLFESAKMASMGEMIANIAHQWRQPLNAITATTAELELESTIGDVSQDELLDRIEFINDRVDYLSNTIDTFRNFIKEKKELKKLILEKRIKNSINIVLASLKDNHITLHDSIDYTQSTELIMVTGELDQVIINILNNAKDILKQKNIYLPWIKLELITDTNKIIISIEDNGGGIPDNIINKVFDPYFTTKHQSQGTGLGLHMSKKIIEESLDGKLSVKNTQNGAKFYIEFQKSIRN